MAIDKSGQWWLGSTPEDLREFLEAYSEEGYKIHEFRLSKCNKCDSFVFRLEADGNSGVARRTCVKCESKFFIGDSDEFWDEADPKVWKCIERKSRQANIGVGFSFYEKYGEVRWLYVGVRCSNCGVLGCFVDWRVGYAPSKHLLDKV